MSFAVTLERLEIHPHPNADALELAQVGLYRAVVPKKVYKSGDYALYIPEQAILPPGLIMELDLVGRLAGRDKNRVKAIRLRGELSQGIVCRPAILTRAFPYAEDIIQASKDRIDLSESLGIFKWVPPIPVHLAGKTEHAPNLVRWLEIENIKRYPDIFAPGEHVIATEKIHGTCCLVTYDTQVGLIGGDGEPMGAMYVSSKGLGSKQLSLLEEPGNLYWRAAKAHGLGFAAAAISGYLRRDFEGGIRAVGLFGEVYGKGVQDLHYGADVSQDDRIGYALFDVAVVDGTGRQHWLSAYDVEDIWNVDTPAGPMLSVPRVPVVYDGPYDFTKLAELAEGWSLLDPGTLREGVVVRPSTERYSNSLGGRAIGKIVGAGYLTRGGEATEYE